MSVSTYDPKDLIIILGSIRVQGYAPGTFVNVERNEDSFALVVGSDGEGARARSNNNSGRATITLLQSSLTNTLFSQQIALDESTGSGVLALLIKDQRGNSLYQAETAWLVKPSAASYGNEIENREWIIETDSMQVLVGSSVL